jgi:6-phosphogluconolactonase
VIPANPRTVYYASVGPLLKLFDVDADGAELRERGAVTVPANIQYAWPHPSRRFLYVVSSNGGPGISGDKHFANAFLINPATGGLSPHGEPARCRRGPSMPASIEAAAICSQPITIRAA